VPELILSLRERVLSRHAITAVRTTIGRDPSCDVVIDNAGISRLHAAIEAVGDSFVLRDCESQNGITLNGEPCREGRLVHGDMIGLNKFLLRFSNQALDVPANLQTEAEKPKAARPKEVQRTVHLDANSAQALAEVAKQHIARQRAELAARGGESLHAMPAPERPRQPGSLEWEEPAGSGTSMAMFVGALVLGGALIAALLLIVF
jgi:pSer/pThr/pTyr-binding forkhead associated (FHA) protein